MNDRLIGTVTAQVHKDQRRVDCKKHGAVWLVAHALYPANPGDTVELVFQEALQFVPGRERGSWVVNRVLRRARRAPDAFDRIPDPK